MRLNYFTESASRSAKEVSKVLAWVSRKLISQSDDCYFETYRRIAAFFASSTIVLTLSERREILLSVLESLLLIHPSTSVIGCDLISVLIASWCSDVAVDGDLSMMYLLMHSSEKLQRLSDSALGQVFKFYRQDLPFNLATYGRMEKLSALCSNQIWRVICHWSKHGGDSEVLNIMKKSFICSSSSDTKEEDFVALTSSMLTESDFKANHTLLLK